MESSLAPEQGNGGWGPTISVVIPVYLGEPFIGETIQSVVDQTFADFELVIINDCSPDASRDVIDHWVNCDSRCVQFITPHNHGSAPRAINSRLAHLRGKWFVYASQDDHFSADWLEKMYDRAIETGADAVIPRLVFDHGGHNNTEIVGLYGDASVLLSGRQAVEYSMDWTIPGFALLRMSLVKRVGFAEFAMNADEHSARRFFHEARLVAFSGGTFFYSQLNPNAVTKQVGTVPFDWPYTHIMNYLFLKENDYPAAVWHAELMRAVKSLLTLTSLLDIPKSVSTPRDVTRDRRIARCLSAFREPATGRDLRNEGRLRDRLLGELMLHGDTTFRLGSLFLRIRRRAWSFWHRHWRPKLGAGRRVVQLLFSGNFTTVYRNRRRGREGVPRVMLRHAKPGQSATGRSRILNTLGEGLRASRYLEIGVQYGYTAENIRVHHRVGVDPSPMFDVSRLPKGFSFFACDSDTYFASLSPEVTFDLAFLDGLHTFEQTSADFFNAVRHVPNGIIVIDDTVPSDDIAALPDLDESIAGRRASGSDRFLGMGDVWKVVVCIGRCHPQLDFRTVVYQESAQTFVWRRRPREQISETSRDEFVTVASLSYQEFFRDGVPSELKPCSEAQALRLCLAAVAREDSPAVPESPWKRWRL
jgi:glycosyltransferase involved in cell wall biosynthesis